MSNSTYTVERLYSLGDYQNIKVSNTITQIPEAVSMDKEASKLLHVLQIIDVEYAYRVYVSLVKNLKGMSLEDSLQFLEAERTQTFQELLASVNLDKKQEEE